MVACTTSRSAPLGSSRVRTAIFCSGSRIFHRGVGPCPRCDRELWRRREDSLNRTLALTLAAAVRYVIANAVPMLGLSAVRRGIHHSARCVQQL